MTRHQVKTVLDRVLTWPEDRQQDAAEMLMSMEEQDKATLHLTDEQVAEVERRLADPNPKFLTLEEVRERFARRERSNGSCPDCPISSSIALTPTRTLSMSSRSSTARKIGIRNKVR